MAEESFPLHYGTSSLRPSSIFHLALQFCVVVVFIYCCCVFCCVLFCIGRASMLFIYITVQTVFYHWIICSLVILAVAFGCVCVMNFSGLCTMNLLQPYGGFNFLHCIMSSTIDFSHCNGYYIHDRRFGLFRAIQVFGVVVVVVVGLCEMKCAFMGFAPNPLS